MRMLRFAAQRQSLLIHSPCSSSKPNRVAGFGFDEKTEFAVPYTFTGSGYSTPKQSTVTRFMTCGVCGRSL